MPDEEEIFEPSAEIKEALDKVDNQHDEELAEVEVTETRLHNGYSRAIVIGADLLIKFSVTFLTKGVDFSAVRKELEQKYPDCTVKIWSQ